MRSILYALGAAAAVVVLILGLGTVVGHHNQKGPVAVVSPTK